MLRIVYIFLLITAPLYAQLNSDSDEQNPILTPDGREIYFTIAHHPLNASGKRDAGDIWFSQLVEGAWSAPVRAKGLINNGGYNAVLGFSADGSEMYVYGHYASSGDAAGSQGISISKRTNEGWSKPSNEEVPYFQNKSVASGGYITPDKKVFVYSAEATNTNGFEDLYVSFNNNGKWTEPKNLGSMINTKSQELSPWISADTKTIFYSSNGGQSAGSFDVLSSERLDETWTNWSPPKNLGLSVNSVGRELFYHIFQNKAYYTSTYNSDGYGDIKEVALDGSTPVVVFTPPIETKQEESKSLVVTNDDIRVFGKVTNSLTGQGVASSLVLHGSTTMSISSNELGNYEVAINPKQEYNVRIEAKGFIGFFEKLKMPEANVKEVQINFQLQPVAVGISINLRSVLFKQSTPELLPDSYDELDMVVDFMKTNPKVQIELAGHTDNVGNSSLNLKLSRDRATRVKNYLSDKGIESKRIKGVGYGGTKPIASNKTEDGKRLNRRVEFRIISVD
jgi:outer membrane protein OmpA-like peptidoglycan-associated protein